MNKHNLSVGLLCWLLEVASSLHNFSTAGITLYAVLHHNITNLKLQTMRF